jgi:GNAT superfamily N-acetyltransferase
MFEIRTAKKSDTQRQKEIWKACFGDSNEYIDFYFANRYRENETLLLLWNGNITSMLTMIPVRVITSDGRSLPSAMLYAIATHPKYQGRGLATRIMDFSDRYLMDNNNRLSLLVPASDRLFDFYGRRGYINGFFIKEVTITDDAFKDIREDAAFRSFITPASPKGYNRRRDERQNGGLYVAYGDGEIAYQKKLSKRTGADIYTIEIDGTCGCAAAERINAGRVLIKELLMPESFVYRSVALIAKLLPAKEYIVRLPANQSQSLCGEIRPFGMIKPYGQSGDEMLHDEAGYLGIAYD